MAYLFPPVGLALQQVLAALVLECKIRMQTDVKSFAISPYFPSKSEPLKCGNVELQQCMLIALFTLMNILMITVL